MDYRTLLGVILLLAAGTSEAAEQCWTFDTSTWTHEERQTFEATAYRLAWETSGRTYDAWADAANPKMHFPDKSTVCFIDPPQAVMDGMIDANLRAQAALDEALRQADAAQATQAQQRAVEKLKGLGLTQEEVDALGRF